MPSHLYPSTPARSHSKKRFACIAIFFMAISGLTSPYVSLMAQSPKPDTVSAPPPPLSLPVSSAGQLLPHARGAKVKSATYDSPSGRVRVAFDVYENALQYQVFFGAERVIAHSNLGIMLADGKDLFRDMAVVGTTLREINEKIDLHFNEKKWVDNSCREVTIRLAGKANPSREINIIFRVYNEAFALRYDIPQPTPSSKMVVSDEITEFSFDRTDLALFGEAATESGYTETGLNSLSVYNELPALLRGANFYCLINEANNQNHSRVKLYRNKNNTLATRFTDGSCSFNGSFKTPWRYVLFAPTAVELAQNRFLLYTLNEDNALGDLSWIKPGKVMRVMNLTTQSAMEYIDFARNLGLQYILFDAGWYGLGYSEEANPRSDPNKVIAQIDMPAVVEYAKASGIGVLLYVNEVAFKHYDVDTFFTLYKTWGIKGIKMGYVEGRSQQGVAYQHAILKKAAQYQFIINIHDQYRPSGTSRTYPNLLTVEGIRGNEYRTNTARHTTTLPFTRFLTGAADYTFCFKDPNELNVALKELKTSKAHQLALSVAFFSPLQHVLWYGVPQHYTKATEIEFFKAVPTVWDDSKYLDGDIGQHVTIARRSGNKWFIGTLNGLTPRSFSIPLDFMAGDAYQIVSYEDEGSTIKKSMSFMAKGEMLQFDLPASSGKVFIVEPGQPTAVRDPGVQPLVQLYPNPTTGLLRVKLPGTAIEPLTVVLTDLTGRLIEQYEITQPQLELNLSKHARGVYIIAVTDRKKNQVFRQKIVLQ
jgi:alpha-glucosidase